MKTILISEESNEIQALLQQAIEEDLIIKLTNGSEFIVSAVDDFDIEIARTRQNQKLMALLDERAKQKTTISLDKVKEKLGFKE
jgi:heme oxygenase